MRVVTYDGQGNILNDFGTSQTPAKSIYTRNQFITKIPKNKIRAIQQKTTTNDDINVWIFSLTMLDKIDLNNLPAWFTEGLDAMVTESIFTQNQINTFLEI